jgi:hypothetical protein
MQNQKEKLVHKRIQNIKKNKGNQFSTNSIMMDEIFKNN